MRYSLSFINELLEFVRFFLGISLPSRSQKQNGQPQGDCPYQWRSPWERSRRSPGSQWSCLSEITSW
ncbi:MAG: hypothetical protein ACBR11_24370 [Microcoleus sp.]|uniref:hypothetical protein n=1 Tax=Microcoleus sp. TaxID=44472 RepID=UPI003525CD54